MREEYTAEFIEDTPLIGDLLIVPESYQIYLNGERYEPGEYVFRLGDGAGPYPIVPTHDRIVRCGQCKHFRELRLSDGTAQNVCSGVMAYVKPDPLGFCAWGER